MDENAGCHAPDWRTFATKLRPFLHEPKGWSSLLIWGRENKISEMHTRGVLAWLAIQGLAFTSGAGSLIKWHLRSTVLAEHPCAECNGFVIGVKCALCGHSKSVPKTKPVFQRLEL